MKVKDLVLQLSSLDQDMDVFVIVNDTVNDENKSRISPVTTYDLFVHDRNDEDVPSIQGESTQKIFAFIANFED